VIAAPFVVTPIFGAPIFRTIAELEPLPARQRFVACLLAAIVLGVVVELVRRRKLREEYSWVWVATAFALLVLAAVPDLLVLLSGWIGSASSVSTLFFGAFVFLLGLVMQFSVRLSRLTHRHRTLAQRMALLEHELARLRAPDEQQGTVGGVHRKPEPERDEVA
jgi:hypothetical protein